MKSSAQIIRETIKAMRTAAEASNNAANSLNTEILRRKPKLASDVTIVRSTATLLQHVVQNFSRTATTKRPNSNDARKKRKTP